MSLSAAPSQRSSAARGQSDSSQKPAGGQKIRAPSWSGVEILALFEVGGDETNLRDLRTGWRNADVYGRMAESLANKGYIRTRAQVRLKVKELRQAYARAREGSSRSGAEPDTCPYLQELDCILGDGGRAVSSPPPPVLDSELEMPVVVLTGQRDEEVEESAEASGWRVSYECPVA